MKYSRKILEEIADDLERYLSTVDRYLVIEGVSEKDYNKAFKRIKKAIKRLRKGDGDDVLDENEYRDYINGRLGESGKGWEEY